MTEQLPPEPLPPDSSVECPACGETVPTGVYCGVCGHHLTHHVDGAKASMRAHTYAAAPDEHVLRLTLVSSLFPHLPHRSRAPFRAGVVLIVAALVVLAALRLQAPLIAVAALGVPLLFQLYLQESDVYEDLPARLLAVAVVLGAALGVGWTLLTGSTVNHSISSQLLGAADASSVWTDGVLIPLVGGVLLLLPAVAVFLIKPPHIDESMDGFLIGSIGAVGYSAAATITRLWPQLKDGIVSHGRPVSGIVVEGLLQGLAVPVTAASIGGVFGAALWVRRRSQVHLGSWLAAARVMGPAALVVYVVLGLIDYYQPPQELLLALHLVVAALALLALRYGVHAVLLHEQHAVRVGPPRVCSECEQVVPTMPFCPHCGAATRAESRAMRARLRLGDAAETARPADAT